MTVETAADRLALLADFGVSATLRPQIGEAATVTGIFDNDAVLVTGDGGAQVQTQAPVFTARTADLTALAAGEIRQDDEIAIDGITYRVVAPRHDGTGMTVLVLEKA